MARGAGPAAVGACLLAIVEFVRNGGLDARHLHARRGQRERTLTTAPDLPDAREDLRLDAGELVEISISDQGPGVPPEERDWIFEPFRTGTASRSSGVGLAICKAIVDQHGGTIDVASREEEGSTFWFRIPLCAITEPVPALELA